MSFTLMTVSLRQLRSSEDTQHDASILQAIQVAMPQLASTLDVIVDSFLLVGRSWSDVDEQLLETLRGHLVSLHGTVYPEVEDEADFIQLFECLVFEYLQHRARNVVEHPKFPDFFGIFLNRLKSRIATVGTLLLAQVPRDSIVKVTRRSIHDAYREALEDFQRLSHDPLTGVLKKEVFERVRRREVERLFRYVDGTILAQLFIDIDKFKTLNDTQGHPAGDRALVRFSEVARATLQRKQLDVIGRYGGDEFEALCLVRSPEEAKHLAEQLRRATQEAFQDDTFPLTITIGVSLFRPRLLQGTLPREEITDHLDSSSSLLRLESDQALLVAKYVRGRNTVVLFHEIGDAERDRANAVKVKEDLARAQKID